MSVSARVQPIDWIGSPEQVVAAWPGEVPLVALCSGGRGDGRWSRWSILARPGTARTIGPNDPDPLGRMTKIVGEPVWLKGSGINEPDSPPFQGGWLVALGYGLGAQIEPAACLHAGNAGTAHNPLWPWPVVLWRCDEAYAHDRETGRWWRIGEGAELPALPRERVRERLSRVPWLWSLEGEDVYVAQVRRAIELIRAGDIFQVNLAHRMTGALDGSARGLFCRMLRGATPWYGAYLEVEDRGQWHNAHFGLSMSPELFLEFDARTRMVTTRPIKGTRASGGERALGASEKDRAELNMIIDLMRNDLGRIAEIGSVRVEDAARIERHAEGEGKGGGAGVVHGVGTVTGRVRAGVGFTDIIRATFPGGSITGAPKIRAMQIIDELHGGARGLYTGSIGYLADNGNFALSIAIRTAMVLDKRETARPRGKAIDEVEEATLSFPVGAGIVADSDPHAEWLETLDKARAFANLVEPGHEPGTGERRTTRTSDELPA